MAVALLPPLGYYATGPIYLLTPTLKEERVNLPLLLLYAVELITRDLHVQVGRLMAGEQNFVTHGSVPIWLPRQHLGRRNQSQPTYWPCPSYSI